MPVFVELTEVNTEIERRWRAQQEAPTGRQIDLSSEEELDDLEQPVTDAEVEGDDPDQDADETTQGDPTLVPPGLYGPIAVFANDMREFYPRRKNMPGTRLVYKNGAARIIKETYAEVKAAFAALG